MMKTYDVSEELKQLNLPTLIISSRFYRLKKPIASELMKCINPNSHLEVLTPAGLHGLVEKHDSTNYTAGIFIDELKGGK